jgi:hypothetical protein
LHRILDDSFFSLSLFKLLGSGEVCRGSSTFFTHSRDLPVPIPRWPINRVTGPAVCTVQVFHNALSGPRMFFFAQYYLLIGWNVIIYDRYGIHRSYLTEFINHPRLFYHPYTVLQLLFPNIYNSNSSDAKVMTPCFVYAFDVFVQVDDVKYYFTRDSQGMGTVMSTIQTSNQNSDKQKTYDLATMHFSGASLLLFVDADEYFHCYAPPNRTSRSARNMTNTTTSNSTTRSAKGKRRFRAKRPMRVRAAANAGRRMLWEGAKRGGLLNQAKQQSDVLHWLARSSFNEIYAIRESVYSLLSRDERNVIVRENSTVTIDTTRSHSHCMHTAYQSRNITLMFMCWSNKRVHSGSAKMIDLAHTCPFHWNHRSCTPGALPSETREDQDNIYRQILFYFINIKCLTRSYAVSCV